MKIIYAFVGCLLLASCKSQKIAESKVPSVVQNTLKEKFVNGKEVEWAKIQKNYEAEVKLNDSTEVTVQIDETGKLIMQKQEIAESDLPTSIRTTLTNSYNGYTIDDAEQLDKNGMVYYQLELEKGTKEQKLIFTADGKEEKGLAFWD